MKICLDAGHGGYDSGAVGKFSKEKDLTLAITLLTKTELEKAGYIATLTRDKDIFKPLNERCIIANENKADIFVSIHINSATNTQANGFEVYCFKMQKDGVWTQAGKLAKAIEKHYIKEVKEIKSDRGVKEANFFVLRLTLMPAILVECGFISNEEEEKILNTKEVQIEIAKAISNGIKDYF